MNRILSFIDVLPRSIPAAILFVAFSAVSVYFVRLGGMTLASDECFFSEHGREMVFTGDYLTPRYGFMPDFHNGKPPFFYWAVAVSGGRIFGRFDELAARFPSAVAAFVTIIAVFFFALMEFENKETAFFSAVILTFTQQFMFHGRVAWTDSLFVMFFTLAAIFFFKAFFPPQSGDEEIPRVFFYLAAGFMTGCAVMTRQMAGFLILPVVVIYDILVGRRGYLTLRNKYFWASMAVMCAVILPWHILMIERYGKIFTGDYFGVNFNFAFHGNRATVNPWYEYFKIIISNYWPWLPLAVVGIYMTIVKFNKEGLDGVAHKKMFYILLWAVVPFAAFQIAKVKHARYILSVYVPLAIFASLAINESIRNNLVRRFIKRAVIAAAFILSVVYILFPVLPRTLDNRELEDVVPVIKRSVVNLPSEEVIYILNNHKMWDYRNALYFYASRVNKPTSFKKMKERIKSGQRYACYFVNRADYLMLDGVTKEVPKEIIDSTVEVVLFRVTK